MLILSLDETGQVLGNGIRLDHQRGRADPDQRARGEAERAGPRERDEADPASYADRAGLGGRRRAGRAGVHRRDDRRRRGPRPGDHEDHRRHRRQPGRRRPSWTCPSRCRSPTATSCAPATRSPRWASRASPTSRPPRTSERRALTVTRGVVSTFLQELPIDENRAWIDSDIRIGSGNSGGASINQDGELVGINTAVVTEATVPTRARAAASPAARRGSARSTSPRT